MTPAPPTECANPGCANPLPSPAGPGRPRLYCSPRCRGRGRATPAAPLTVEVDHQPDDTNPGRPAGRVWLVRIRRGDRHVTVASELGRPTADHLATQITDIITPPARARTPPTD